MDLSKLPRLSNSQPAAPSAPPPSAPPPTLSPAPIPETPRQTVPDYAPAPSSSIRGEAWIALAVGVILLLMFPRFLQWASSQLFHTHFNQYVMPDGVTIVPYTQVHDLWPDLGCTLFGLTLVVEGLAMLLSKRRWIVWGALAFTILTTGYNLVYLVGSFSQYGLAVVSALAVAFGVYIAVMQWQLLRSPKQFR